MFARESFKFSNEYLLGMKYLLLILALLFFLASCAAPEPEAVPTQPECKWPEIPYEGGCCKDLNENNICDRVEFAEEIEQQKQQEYEEAAQKARKIAEQTGKFKQTVLDDILDAVKQVTSYKFIYQGDNIEVQPDKVVRKLVQDKNLGVQTIDGRRQEIIVNTIHLFPAEKRAEGSCVPAEEFVRTLTPSPCDEILDNIFVISYEEFMLNLPIDWLILVEHREPYEILSNQHVGKRRTTLYRVRIGEEKINLWIDDNTMIPIAAERWKGDTRLVRDEYIDLQKI